MKQNITFICDKNNVCEIKDMLNSISVNYGNIQRFHYSSTKTKITLYNPPWSEITLILLGYLKNHHSRKVKVSCKENGFYAKLSSERIDEAINVINNITLNDVSAVVINFLGNNLKAS